METPKDNKYRTATQNKALHAYLTMIAHELSNQGQTMQKVIQKFPAIEITPTKDSVKSIIWKPIQEAVLGKKSTTGLTTAEVTQVYEVMRMFLAKEFEISLPFPSYEQSDNYLKSYENTISSSRK